MDLRIVIMKVLNNYETRINIHKIQQEAQTFVDEYIAHISGNLELSKEEFKRRYQFSTLKYFHKELGILK